MITGKHIETGENLQKHIEKECSGVVERYMAEPPLDMNITVRKDAHHAFCIEGTIHISKQCSIHCHGHDTDAYKAVDNLVRHLEIRIQKYKTRLRDRKRRSSQDTSPIGYFVIDAHQPDEGHDTPLVIAESAKEIDTLTVGDAVMKMDLLSQHVLLFKNAAHGSLNIVYRRDDGHIGWVDPTKTLA